MIALTTTHSNSDSNKGPLVYCVVLINVFILGAIFYLFSAALHSDSFIFSKLYYKKILLFTVLQAVMGAFLCTMVALLVLPSLFSKAWNSKEKFYSTILNLPYFTPSLIGAFAIISIFGQSGLVSAICAKLGIKFETFVYGLAGILLAHLFFYVPVVLKNFRRSMDFFPEENARLAQILGMSKWRFWFTVVLPFLKTDIIRMFALVCLYCLRSFTTILVLGGGALKTNTLEVALFQALQFESNTSAFAQIAITQFIINSCFFATTLFAEKLAPKNDLPATPLQLSRYSGRYITILPVLVFIAIALGLVFMEGLLPVGNFISLVLDPEVIWCCCKNIFLGLMVCVLTLGLSFMLIHAQRVETNSKFLFLNFEIFGYYTLIFSPLVIASSFIFLLQQFAFNFAVVIVCIIIMQVLSSLPGVYRVLASSYAKQLSRYNALCAVNGIYGLRRFLAVDWPILKPAIGFSVAYILTFSLGDARSFLFFNIGDNVTLITLLFERIRSYHFKEAAALATLILILCYIVFYTCAKIFGDYKAK